MDYEKQIDIIIDTAKKVQLNKVTVLTGRNGSGKSLLRKILDQALTKVTDKEVKIASVSMQSRTQPKDGTNGTIDMSALKSMMIDNGENPTSSETLYNIDSLIRSVSEKYPRYLVIDEPEIGMGEEMVASLVNKLNTMFVSLPSGCLGIMIITHNRYIIKNLTADFLNIEGMTKEEWLNREIVPIDIEQFKIDSLELYRAVNKRIEQNKKDRAKEVTN